MATATNITGFGKMSIKKVETCRIQTGFDADNTGDATTDGDLVLEVNNGDTDPGVFATTKLTFHYNALLPTFTFEAGTQLSNVAVPQSNLDAANKQYVDAQGGGSTTTLVTNDLVTIPGNSPVGWSTANLLSGLIIRNSTADVTDTLPTAQAMIAAISGATVGSTIDLAVQKSGTHRILFAANNGSAAEGKFLLGGGGATSTSVFIPALENLRTTTLKIIVRNITPDNMVCELVLISDR